MLVSAAPVRQQTGLEGNRTKASFRQQTSALTGQLRVLHTHRAENTRYTTGSVLSHAQTPYIVLASPLTEPMPNPVTRLAARLTRYFQNKEEAMQIALNPTSAPAGSFSGNTLAEVAGQPSVTPLTHYQIIRRNGAVVPFAPDKIAIAMMKAFLAVHGTQGAASASVRGSLAIVEMVMDACPTSRWC